MANIFFVKERCPLSLSLAGFFMNKGDKCVEILEGIQWIIPVKDESSLCYATLSVIDILKNNYAHRVFVHGAYKNIDAVILASIISGLDVIELDPVKTSTSTRGNFLRSTKQVITTVQTYENYVESASITAYNEGPQPEDEIFVSPKFPVKSNWFYNHVFYSVIPKSIYAHDNYELPNYVAEGESIDDRQRVQALQICKFLKAEAKTTWPLFDREITSKYCNSELPG